MDESQLRGLLEEHHAASYGWALNCCAHDSLEAEDVLQNAYLKILQLKARFDGRSSFKSWLFAVIRRTAADERRRHWLRRLRLERYSREQETWTLASSHVPAEERSELCDAFRQALKRLPGRQREILHLAFYQDLTLEEAAGVMGVTVGTARTHYERGKARLREWFQQSEFDNEYRAG